MTTGTIFLVSLLLVLPGCARHKRQPSSSNAGTAAPASNRPITPVADTLTPVAQNVENPQTAPVSRPSPFSDLHDADRQQVRSVTNSQPSVTNTQPTPLPLTTPTPATATTPPAKVAPGTPSSLRKPLKPFDLTRSDRISAQDSRDRALPLPAPPPLASIIAPVPPPALARKPCCLGTAYIEPAKPAGLRRVFHKVPGLRRIGQHPEAEEGYVAAKPKRDVTMMLPPEARAALRDGRMDLKASVDESGRVTRVELLAPKDEELVRLASYAASDWSFTPARVNDKTVPSEVIMHFNFGN